MRNVELLSALLDNSILLRFQLIFVGKNTPARCAASFWCKSVFVIAGLIIFLAAIVNTNVIYE